MYFIIMYLKLGKMEHTMGKKISKLYESSQSIRVIMSFVHE